MRASICENSTIGESNTLTDTRDNSTYTVSKLNDGKCWMTQNLRITNTEITSENSNTTENFIIPTSSAPTLWPNDSSTTPYAYYDKETTSAYYNWYAATAGTGIDSMSSGDTTSSICPKGWRLPKSGTGVGTNDFANVSGISTSTNITAGTNYWSKAKAPSFTNSTLIVNNSTWLAAGYVRAGNGSGSIDTFGSTGYYWSSTADRQSYAYYFLFFNNSLYPADSNSRSSGYSIRCISADLADDEPDFTDPYDQKDVDVIAIVVPPVISINATSGMNKEVDPNLVAKGEISATISANTTYSVQLSADKTSLTNSVSSDEPTSTNSIPASSSVQAKTNAWGILNSDNTTYSAITSTPTTYYNTESSNEDSSRTHTFTLGVSISPTLPAGEYSTTVTITAVNN